MSNARLDCCPHCGASLPNSRDAFCPECRESLDAAESSINESVEGREHSAAPEVSRAEFLYYLGIVAFLLWGIIVLMGELQMSRLIIWAAIGCCLVTLKAAADKAREKRKMKDKAADEHR